MLDLIGSVIVLAIMVLIAGAILYGVGFALGLGLCAAGAC